MLLPKAREKLALTAMSSPALAGGLWATLRGGALPSSSAAMLEGGLSLRRTAWTALCGGSALEAAAVVRDPSDWRFTLSARGNPESELLAPPLCLPLCAQLELVTLTVWRGCLGPLLLAGRAPLAGGVSSSRSGSSGGGAGGRQRRRIFERPRRCPCPRWRLARSSGSCGCRSSCPSRCC